MFCSGKKWEGRNRLRFRPSCNVKIHHRLSSYFLLGFPLVASLSKFPTEDDACIRDCKLICGKSKRSLSSVSCQEGRAEDEFDYKHLVIVS